MVDPETIITGDRLDSQLTSLNETLRQSGRYALGCYSDAFEEGKKWEEEAGPEASALGQVDLYLQGSGFTHEDAAAAGFITGFLARRIERGEA